MTQSQTDTTMKLLIVQEPNLMTAHSLGHVAAIKTWALYCNNRVAVESTSRAEVCWNARLISPQHTHTCFNPGEIDAAGSCLTAMCGRLVHDNATCSWWFACASVQEFEILAAGPGDRLLIACSKYSARSWSQTLHRVSHLWEQCFPVRLEFFRKILVILST